MDSLWTERFKALGRRGCVTLFKTRQSHAVRFSFIPVVMRSPGLKPIGARNARSSSACVSYLATEPEAAVGAETRPRADCNRCCWSTRLPSSAVDPHKDSIHIGPKNRMKPAVSDKHGRGRVSRAASLAQVVSFGSSYDDNIYPRPRPRHRRY